MLYLDNRPITPASRHHAANGPDRFYQWRGFFESDFEVLERFEADFDSFTEETGVDQFFLLPGRANTITVMHDDSELEVRKIVSTEGALQQWEVGVKTEFPMKRVTAALIGTYVPRFRGACSSAADPAYLADALSKKSRHYVANTSRRVTDRNGVQIRIETLKFENRTVFSVMMRSDDPAALNAELRRCELSPEKNTHLGDYLGS